MKKIYIIAILAVFLLSSDVLAVSGGIKWMNHKEGIEQAEKQGKKVFIYFHAKWCGYCTKMNQSTFKNINIIKYLNDNFIPVIVDSDQEKKISAQYGVRGLPVLWFLKNDSKAISNVPGYIDAKKLLVILKYINTESYKKMNYDDFKQTM